MRTSLTFVLVFLCVLFLLPFVPLLLTSLSSGWEWPELIPPSFSFRAWHYLFSSHASTWEAMGTSVFIAFSVSLINLLLALPAANALARMPMKAKGLIEAVLFAPIVVPPFVAVMGIHLTFIQLGLSDSIRGVLFAHIIPTLPYMIRALIVSYRTLGFQWEDQARVLGAGRVQRFWYVVLPHLLPGIVVGASLSILVSFSQYLITFLVGGGQVLTLPLVLFPFISGGDPAVGAAYTTLFVVMAGFALYMMEMILGNLYGKRLDQPIKDD